MGSGGGCPLLTRSKQDQQGLLDSECARGWRSLGNLLHFSVALAVKKERCGKRKFVFYVSLCPLPLILRSLAVRLCSCHQAFPPSEQSQLPRPVLTPHILPSLKPCLMLCYCGVPALLTQFPAGACSREQPVCHQSCASVSPLCAVHLGVRGSGCLWAAVLSVNLAPVVNILSSAPCKKQVLVKVV